MTFTIQIQPGSPFGADKDERLSDARLLASEVGQLEGVEKAEYSETVQKAHGLENPIVVTAVITGSFLIVTTLIDNLFRLLREKRKKGKYEAFSLQIHNHYYHLADDTEAPVKAEIEKLIEDADKRTVTLET